MNTKMWILPILIVGSGAACSSAQFGSKGNRLSEGAVAANSSQIGLPNAPIDISQGANAAMNGPTPGPGAVLDKSIQLTCDQAQGAIVVVAPPGAAVTPVTSTATSTGLSTSTGKAIGDGSGKAVDTSGKAISLLGDPYDPTGGTGIDGDPAASGKAVGDGGGSSVVIGSDGKAIGDAPGKGIGKDTPEVPPQQIVPSSKVIATVQGQFCPKATNKLTVLFVVDFSGSMGAHADTVGGPTLPGNDPQVNGTCGRLQAAQTIVQKIQSTMSATDDVEIGFIPFAGGVVTSRVIGLTPFTQFASNVNAGTFCQYIIQGPSWGVDPVNPGGIDGSTLGIDASTNYQAAFQVAQTLLGGIYGNKLVYFISDGEPTRPGNGAVATDQSIQASVQAGQALLNGVDNLTLNGLLLQNFELGQNALTTLTAVTGSPSRVRLASDAADLANQITQFPDGSIDTSTGKATLTVAPYPQANLGLQYLSADPATPDVWDYLTEPFVLLGTPGQDTLNLVTVTAQGKDGETYTSTVQITYRMQ